MAQIAIPNGPLHSDVRSALNTNVTDAETRLAAIESGKQPIDADLTALAALSPTNDDILQRKSGAWTNRTMAQLKTDLSLSNVDNTSDANKPVSTAQQTALDLKAPLASPTFTGTLTIPDEAYGSAWNGKLQPASKNAVYDKIETLASADGATLLLSRFNRYGLAQFAADATAWSNQRLGNADATATLLAGITAVDTANAAEIAAGRPPSYVLDIEPSELHIGAGNTAVGSSSTNIVPRIMCTSNDVTIVIDGKTTNYAIEFAGTYGSDIPFSVSGTDNTNDATTGIGAPSRGQKFIKLNTSSHGLTAGMWIKVCSADLIGGLTNLYWGEPARVASVSGALIELEETLCYTYTRATSFVRRIIGQENVLLHNFTIVNPNPRTTTAGSIRLNAAIDVLIDDIRQVSIDNIGFGLRDVVGGIVRGVTHRDAASDASTNGRNPYCIQTQDATGYLTLEDCVGTKIRTTITCNNSGGATAKYGAPTRVLVKGCKSYDNDTVGFSTHTPGLDNEYNNCRVEGVNKTAFANEARYTRVVNCVANDTAIFATTTDQGFGMELVGNKYENPYRYSYWNTSDYVYGSWVEEHEGGQFLKVTTGTVDLTDIRIVDNIARCASQFVLLSADNCHRLTIQRNIVTCGLANRSGARAFLNGSQAQTDINNLRMLDNSMTVAAADQLIGDGLTVSTNLHPAASATAPNFIQGLFVGTGHEIDRNSINTTATSMNSAMLASGSSQNFSATAQSMQMGPGNKLNGVTMPYIVTYNTDAGTSTFAVDYKYSQYHRLRPNAAGANTLTLVAGTSGGERLKLIVVHAAASNTIAKPSNVSGTWPTFSTTSGHVDEVDLEWNASVSKWVTLASRLNVAT